MQIEISAQAGTHSQPHGVQAKVTFNDIIINIDEAGVIRNGTTSSNYILNTLGLFISGYDAAGELWANGVQPSYGFYDYVKGTVESGEVQKGIFTISKESEIFGSEWISWKQAVELGAEFYDGDGDGKYIPVDKNQNGTWDSNEDRPAFYGDVSSFSVFNDAVPSDERRLKGVEPKGINIKQTIWGYQNKPNFERVLFIKYTVSNSGNITPYLRNIIFSITPNPDLGYYGNDLGGCDTITDAGFTYDLVKDYYFQDAAPSFLISLIQGPPKQTYNPEDLYYYLEGENFEVKTKTGAQNTSMGAHKVIIGASIFSSVDRLRAGMEGIDLSTACDDNSGQVFQIDCEHVNPRFMYSGDIIRQRGWINTHPRDQRFLMSTEPFDLKTGESVDIIFAVIVGEGETGLDALEDAFAINKNSKLLYFEPVDYKLPVVDPIVIAEDGTIQLIWETSQFFNYNLKGPKFDIAFEGFEVFMYASPNPVDEVNGQKNSALIAKYDVKNNLNSLLLEKPDNYGIEVFYENGIQLEKEIYGNSETGRIILEIDRDPFTLNPLIKGKPYFISINSFAINKKSLEFYDIRGTYLIPKNSYIGLVKSEPGVINYKGNVGIIIDEFINDPYFSDQSLQHVKGISGAKVTYSVYNKSLIDDDIYELTFSRAGSELYELNYHLKNLSTGEILIDSINVLEADGNIQNLVDGFTLDIEWIEPKINSVEFIGENKWFKNFDGNKTGVFYVGKDFTGTRQLLNISTRYSNVISFDKTRKVEIQFGDTSKAYRYVRTAVRFTWKGKDGLDSGYVNVPFSAYTVDDYGNKTQLATAFLENAFYKDEGAADGQWNPGSDLTLSNEYLVILNSEYSDDPYTHAAYIGSEKQWADIVYGYNLEPGNSEISDSIKAIARSPWFNAMYIVGFETEYYQPEFEPHGVVTIEPSKVLTPEDKYILRVKTDYTSDEKKNQFDKINIFPNPLFGYNSSSGFFGGRADEPFITFSNLPVEATIKIYTLSGTLVKTIYKNDLSSMLRWNLQNESGRRIGSGLFLALIENPGLGQKVLKFSVIMPQKQVHTK